MSINFSQQKTLKVQVVNQCYPTQLDHCTFDPRRQKPRNNAVPRMEIFKRFFIMNFSVFWVDDLALAAAAHLKLLS